MYLWLKALHIISMVAWFAGLFYIFRLFVYHVQFKDKPDMGKAYGTMEYKLLYYISYPAMVLTIIFGFSLLRLNPGLMYQSWFHYKLACVVVLVAYQLFAGYTRKRFARDDFFLTEKACRLINEVPTIVLICVVILVVVRS